MAGKRTTRLRTATLPAGTPLHHGTRCIGDFMAPDGPAWFAYTDAAAEDWASWSSVPPPGRRHGPERVLSYETVADLVLVDTRELRQWQALGMALLRDPDPDVGEIAAAVRAAGYNGWLGRAEVMLCDPGAALAPAPASEDVAGPAPGR